MKIYLAGRMSGMPNNGYDLFINKAQHLRGAGWDVISPAEMDVDAGLDADREFTRADYMQAARRDLRAIKVCQAIYMMDDYEHSPGACWEWAYAKELGLTIYYETPMASHLARHTPGYSL